MLISPVLGYERCAMRIYLEEFIVGTKTKLRNPWVYIRERGNFYFWKFLVYYDFTISFKDYLYALVIANAAIFC